MSKDDPERYVAGLPVVSFHLTDEMRKQFPHVKQASVSTLLRVKGWILPNYPLPPNEEKIEILRAVIRESFSTSTSLLLLWLMAGMVDKLVEDIVEVTEILMSADEVDIEAFARPNRKPTLHERIDGKEKWGGWGKWAKQKVEEFRAKMKEQQHGKGIFKRGVC